ncbi:hypothetical protein G159_19385 [Planococcus glaciei CHR43]|uniref:DNA cytosine methyltransferase n=1 Tax=Planococcus glaciei TaxID=459472 RepID=UPI0003DF0752|nr:DNA cytosine methyltransferase [Planococcus glaciei]ETP67311.1 hypothetical protein G159_19385 [Planococcus glaciei CHR43]
MRVVDLFCGAGGFSEGFYRAGFEIVRAYDIWSPAVLTHNMNHSDGKEVALKGDILEIAWSNDEEFEDAIPDSEVIIGSPPCIAFSNSNKSGKADKESGVALIKAFLRIVARKKYKKNSKLKYWVMENVGNSEKYVNEFYSMEELGLEGLTDEKLCVKGKTSKLYNMKYFGVPTNRIRYICGDFPPLNETTSESEIVSLGKILKELGKPSPNDFEKLNDKIIDPTYGFEIFKKDLSDHHYVSEIPDFEWKKAKRQKVDKGYMGKMAFPENMDKPARTVMATLSRSSRESMIFPIENEVEKYRIPTIREVATLMSFPIDFRFYGENESIKYRMVGNAVTPKFSYELAKSIQEDSIKNNFKDAFMLKDGFSSLKRFPSSPDFTDLNGKVFPLKQEKPKKVNAKFKQHVPELVEKTFRVELQNKFTTSNYETVEWDVSIHRSQGKNAEVFSNILIPEDIFPISIRKELKSFINELLIEIKDSQKLQINYCKTKIEREDSIGPEELLEKIKVFVNSYTGDFIEVNGINRMLPYKIALAYFILNNILEELNYAEENTRREVAY